MTDRRASDDHLYADLKDAKDLAPILLEIISLHALSGELDISETLSGVLGNAESILKRTLDLEDFNILLLDDTEKELVVWKADPGTTRFLKGKTIPLGEGVSGRVAKTGESILLQVARQNPWLLPGKEAKTDVGSFLSLPLKARDGRVMGVFNVQKPQPHGFGKNEMMLFTTASVHIANALESATLQKTAARHTITDGLTGLYTRRYFIEALKKDLQNAIRHATSFTVLTLGVDGLEAINQQYGYAAGDLTLMEIAARLKSVTRAGDVLARAGGDRFYMLMHGADLSGAMAAGEKICNAVNGDFAVRLKTGETITPRLTAGAAAYPECGLGMEELLEAADKALYKAKREARGALRSAPVRAATKTGERRQHKRFPVAWEKVIGRKDGLADCRIVTDDGWHPVVIENISLGGMKALLPVRPAMDRNYTCKVSLKREDGSEEVFRIRCVNAQPADNGHQAVGMVVADKSPGWLSVYRALTS